MPIVYDEDIVYDSPDYTYDGYFCGDLVTFKEALFRELRAVLSSLVADGHIVLDERLTYSNDDSDYPWVIIRRITDSEDNCVRAVRDRWEIEVICRTSSATKGADLAEDIRDTIREAFSGQGRRLGAFDSDGDALPESGIIARCFFVNYVPFTEGDETGERIGYAFSYVRQV